MRSGEICFMWTLLLSLMLLALNHARSRRPRKRFCPCVIERLCARLTESSWTEAKPEWPMPRRRRDAATKAQEAAKNDATTKRQAIAQMKLAQAEREIEGTEDGITPCTHANTEWALRGHRRPRLRPGRSFKGDSIVIRLCMRRPPRCTGVLAYGQSRCGAFARVRFL